MKNISESSNHAAFWLSDRKITITLLMRVLRKERKLKSIVKEILLDDIAKEICLSEEKTTTLMKEFRQKYNLGSEEELTIFLNKNKLNLELLIELLERPEKLSIYREDRWGNRANSLYLKHKDLYDQFTYRRLESNDENTMQEVFFRLKDNEESWESLATQFQVPEGGLLTSIPAGQIEPELLASLRKSGYNTIIRPLRISSGKVVVAELSKIKPTEFNSDMKTLILIREFEEWIEEECNRILDNLEVPA